MGPSQSRKLEKTKSKKMDDEKNKKEEIYEEFPGLNDEIEQAKSGNVQVCRNAFDVLF
jgi:hypothetical protein